MTLDQAIQINEDLSFLCRVHHVSLDVVVLDVYEACLCRVVLVQKDACTVEEWFEDESSEWTDHNLYMQFLAFGQPKA